MNAQKNIGWFLLVIVAGVLLGSLMGSVASHFLPVLAFGPGPLGVEGVHVDLGIISMSFSLLIDLNLAGLLGLILSILLFKKL